MSESIKANAQPAKCKANEPMDLDSTIGKKNKNLKTPPRSSLGEKMVSLPGLLSVTTSTTASSSASVASGIASLISRKTVTAEDLGFVHVQVEHVIERTNKNTAKLQFAVIKEAKKCQIMVKFVPDVQPIGCFLEMHMYQALRNHEPWFASICLNFQFYELHVNRIKQYNNRDYPFRVFNATIGNKPTTNQIITFGRVICKNINALPQSSGALCVDSDILLWLENPTWYDVVGSSEAMSQLKSATGEPSHTPNYYKTFNNIIGAFFPCGSMTPSEVELLGVPTEYLHPRFHEVELPVKNEDDHSNKENEDPTSFDEIIGMEFEEQLHAVKESNEMLQNIVNLSKEHDDDLEFSNNDDDALNMDD